MKGNIILHSQVINITTDSKQELYCILRTEHNMWIFQWVILTVKLKSAKAMSVMNLYMYFSQQQKKIKQPHKVPYHRSFPSVPSKFLSFFFPSKIRAFINCTVYIAQQTANYHWQFYSNVATLNYSTCMSNVLTMTLQSQYIFQEKVTTMKNLQWLV